MKKLNWLSMLMNRFRSRPKVRRRPTKQLNAEGLEDRTLLSSLTLSGGSVLLRSLAATDNAMTISYDGGLDEYTFTDPNETITTTIPGAVGSGTNSVTIPAAGVTNRVRVRAGDGNDTVTVNSLKTNNVALDVDAQGGVNDFIILNTDVTNQTANAGTLVAETILLGGDFESTLPITITGDVTLTDDVSLAGNLVTITGDVNSFGFERDLAITGTTININGAIGNFDEIDVFSTNGTTNANDSITANEVDMTGTTNLFADVAAVNGSVDFTGLVNIHNDLNITTGNAVGNDVTSTGNISGVGSPNLTINAGSGDVTVTANVQGINNFVSTAATSSFNTILANSIEINGTLELSGIATASTAGITVNGHFNYMSDVSLNAANGQDVIVTGNIGGAGGDLTVNALSGMLNEVNVSGNVAGVDQLFIVSNSANSVSFDGFISANDIFLNAATIMLGGDLTALTNSVDLMGDVILTGDTIISSGLGAGDNVTVSGTLNSEPGSNFSATLRAGDGTVIANSAAIGGIDELTSFSAEGSDVLLGDVTVLNDITVRADTFATGFLTGAGILDFNSHTAGLGITVAGNNAATLSIKNSDLAKFVDGFNKIIIGDATSGNVVVNAANFLDTIEIGSGGTITTNGVIIAGGLGNFASVLLNADNVSLANNVFSFGGAIIVDGNLTSPGSFSLTTGHGGTPRGLVQVNGNISAPAGDVLIRASWSQVAGNTNVSGELEVNNTARADFTGSITADDLILDTPLLVANNMTSGTGIDISGRVVLNGNANIVTGGLVGDDLSIVGTLKSGGGNTFDAMLNAGAGDVSVGGDIGGINNLNVSGETISVRSTTANGITLTGTTIEAASNLRALTGNILVDGDLALVGGNVQIAAPSASTVEVTGNVTATNQNLTVVGGPSLAAATFGGTINGVGDLHVRADLLTFGGAVSVQSAFVTSDNFTIAHDFTANQNIYVKGDTAITVDGGVAVLSNLGKIDFVAPTITNNGTVTATVGVVTFNGIVQ